MASSFSTQTLQLALKHYEAGRVAEAEQIGREILARQPQSIEALHLLGVIALRNEEFLQAEELTRKAIDLSPVHAAIQSNHGEACRRLGRFHDAIGSFRRALELQPDCVDALNNLGLTLTSLRQLSDAVIAFQRALALKPDFAQAHYNLAIVLTALHRSDEAIASFERALALHPLFPEALIGLGTLFNQQGQFDRAYTCLDQAVRLRPDSADAYYDLGNLCKDAGRLEEAVRYYRRAVKLQPNSAAFRSTLILGLQYQSAPAIIDEELRNWERDHGQPLARFIQPPENDRLTDRSLRVGYVSGDLRRHAVSFFLLPIFQAHNHRRFHVTAYAASECNDDVTERLRTCTDAWCNITQLSDDAAAQRIREDRIDVLVDLSGHTGGNRLPVFARKPAPIQVSYLGFPGLTGLEAIDFFLSDPRADPPSTQEKISTAAQRIWRLPESAWCFAPIHGQPEVSPLPASERGYITFGCFNNAAKITDDMIRCWARILQRVRQSRLVFKNLSIGSLGVVPRLQAAFAQHDVAPERLGFLRPQASHLDHLACYHQVDIALDTYPYHGTTTTCEALAMGVPVVTLAGDRHLSRVGVSLLTNIGLPEFIAPSADAYVDLALAAASDLSRLANLRASLRAKMARSPLMDAPRFARNLEAAYRAMWERWCARSASAPHPTYNR